MHATGCVSLASQPYFSAYAHAHAKVGMRIRGKILLARETKDV